MDIGYHFFSNSYINISHLSSNKCRFVMVHVEATYRWPATKVPGIVSGCVGVVVGLLSGLFPSSFGLTPDGADVVQYPDPVNAVFFGLTAACLTFLSFSTTWVIVKGKKKRQIRKLAAILSAILLVFLLVWMALYPVSPVLATQIFVVLFTFAFCLQIATISNLGLLPSALAAIVFTWTTTILLVSFQNTVGCV